MKGIPKRPGVTPEITRVAAQTLGRTFGWSQSMTDEVAKAYQWPAGGFRVAYQMKKAEGWSYDEYVKRALEIEEMYTSVNMRVREARLLWAKTHNIQATIPQGTDIGIGIVQGVYPCDAATYMVREHEPEDGGGMLLLWFEEAEEMLRKHLHETARAEELELESA